MQTNHHLNTFYNIKNWHDTLSIGILLTIEIRMSSYSRMPLQDFRIELFMPEVSHRRMVCRHLIDDLDVIAKEYEEVAGNLETERHRYDDLYLSFGDLLDRIRRAEKALAEVGYVDTEGFKDRRLRAHDRVIKAWASMKRS